MKRRLTRRERRKYLGAYVVVFACALIAHDDSPTYFIGMLAGACAAYAESMYARARNRRFFRNSQGSLLTITGSDPSLAERMTLDSSFVEVSPKDAA